MSQENVAQNEDFNQQDQVEVNAGKSTELDACKDKVASLEERLRYLSADFDNYRRNADKERSQWFIRAQGEVLLELLAVVDDFDRAFDAAGKQIAKDNTDLASQFDFASWLEGFSFIKSGLEKILKKYEVEQMPTKGEFDPEKHEALQQVASDDHESGFIVSVLRKGYLYKGVVLRTAQVIVAA